MNIKSLIGPALLVAALMACTAFDGATTHLPAFFLRLIMVAGVFLFWPKQTRLCHFGEILTPCLALLSLALGLSITPVIGQGINPAITTVICIALFLALLYSATDHTTSLLRCLVVVGAAHSLWAIGQWLAADERASGGFFNPNNLAAFLAPLTLVALIQAMEKKDSSPLLWWFISGLILCGISCTLSRSGLATLGVSVSILLVGKHRKKALLPIIGFGLLTASLLLWRQFGVDQTDPYSLSRLAIWKASVDVALSNPLGVGLGGYGDAMRVHGVPLDGFIRYPKLATQAHSEFFQVWTELGWLGLIALLSGVCTVGYTFKKRYSAGQPISRDLAIFSSFALPALASTTMHAPIIPAVATIWVAGALRPAMPLGAPTTLNTGKSRIPYAGFCCALALCLALPGVVGDHYRTRAVQLRSQRNIPDALESARLAAHWAPWSIGNHLLKESLHYINENEALKSSEQLVDLAAGFPHDPRPVQRALWLLDKISPDDVALSSRSAIRRGLLEELTSRDPINALAWRDLALVNLDERDLNSANLSLSRCVEVEPHCASCLAIQADILKQNGNLPEAIQVAQRALIANKSVPLKMGEYSTKILHLNPKMKKLIMEVTNPRP